MDRVAEPAVGLSVACRVESFGRSAQGEVDDSGQPDLGTAAVGNLLEGRCCLEKEAIPWGSNCLVIADR